MKVLIAGASGAIGRPLIRCLRENRHAVIALVRSPESSRAVAEAGAEPVIADALDAAARGVRSRGDRPFGPDAVYYATRLRGAANDKAKRELQFRPRPLEWLSRAQPKP